MTGTSNRGESSNGSQGQVTVLQTNSMITEYDPNSNFCDWLQRLEIHFAEQNAVDNEDRKKAILLKSIGAEPYSLIRSLCDPKKPSEMKYDELVALLDEHYTPPSIVFRERYNFYSATKDKAETAAAWYAKVKKLAMTCKFTALEEIVRDKFVIGLASHEKIFDRLCEETASLKATDALKKAMIIETKVKANDHTVNFIKKSGKGYNTKGNKGQSGSSKGHSGNSGSGESKGACTHCGWRNHTSSMCRYKESNCNICSKRGHIATICRQKGDKKFNSNAKTVGNIFPNEINNDFFSYRDRAHGDSFSLYMIKGTHSSDASILNIAIDGIKLSGKCDTGSPCTLMSADTFDRHFDRRALTPFSGIPYKDYGGHPIPNIGEFVASVNCADQTKDVRIIVTKYANRPILLGEDFLEAFGVKLTCNGRTLNEVKKFSEFRCKFRFNHCRSIEIRIFGRF